MLGELTAAQIEQLLKTEVVGRIGCHSDGRTYVVPITYVYEDGAVYGHSAVGQKIRMMRSNPRVCFEVDHMDDLANWRSVIAYGGYQELAGGRAEAAMKLLMSRLAPLMVSESATPTHGFGPGQGQLVSPEKQTAVLFRLVLDEKSGRYEKR